MQVNVRAKELLNDFERMQQTFQTEGKTLVDRLSLIGERAAKNKAPVDTGNLRRSVRVVPTQVFSSQIRGGFATNVEYAPFVNNGHRTRHGGYVTGKHFMEAGEMEIQAKSDAEIARFLGKVIK
ncbi:HK97 gp10 family phage protein [Bacillus thuringiensis]